MALPYRRIYCSLHTSGSERLCGPVPRYQGLCSKECIRGVSLGLSGGVDSALTMIIAVDALGADKVEAVMVQIAIYRRYKLIDARVMAKTLGVRYSGIVYLTEFLPNLKIPWPASSQASHNRMARTSTEENLQARIRGTLLMALSNKYGSILSHPAINQRRR